MYFWDKRKTGFTLAEVLITLGIIGVVAAMTLPALIQKQQEKATVVRLKKAYSILSQAYMFAVQEYGTPDTWGMSGKQPINDDKGQITGYDSSGIELERAILTKFMKGQKCNSVFECFSGNVTVMNLAKTVDNKKLDLKAHPVFALNDGTVILFGSVFSPNCTRMDLKPNACSDILVLWPDKKGQIIRGINDFMFFLTKDGIVPHGREASPVFPFETHCSLTSTNRNNGHGCTAWVLYNGNMDYLHCSGLSWNGKKKCK